MGWHSKFLDNIKPLTEEQVDAIIKGWNLSESEQLEFAFMDEEVPKRKICDCGAEKTYGPNSGHSDWCSVNK